MEQRNKVRGLAHDRNVAKVTLVEVPDQPGVAAAVFEPLADAGINVDMIVQNIGHGGATDLSFTIPQVELAKAKRILEPVARELGVPRADDGFERRQDLDRRRRDPERARLRRPDVQDPRRRGRQHRDDLDLGDPDHDDHRRGRPRDRRPRAPPGVRAGAARRRSRRPRPGDDDRGAAVHRPPPAVRRRRLDERRRPQLAGRRRARGLPRRRRRADGRTRPGGPNLDGAAGHGAAAQPRLPTDLARTEPRLAAGGDRQPGDGRSRRGRRRPAAPRRSASSGRTTSWSSATARPSSWRACSARPTASARPTRSRSSASA